MGKKVNGYNDHNLLKMAAEGNRRESQQAFGELYNRYSTLVYTFCQKYLHDDQTAEDIFQDTFIKFYDIIKEKKDVEFIGGYLTNIARNLCHNEVRKKHKEFSEFEENLFKSDQKDRIEEKEYKELLDKALQSLPYEYKEFVILKEFLDMKYKEIAELMETNISDVRTKIYRAKQMLKDYLKVYVNEYNKIK